MNTHKITIAILVSILMPYISYAHGELHSRIEEKTNEIELANDSANLYLERGILYYQHEKYIESKADFLKCATLQHKSDKLNIALAKTYLKLEEASLAIKSLDLTLAKQKKHVVALRWKAKAYQQLNQFETAALLFENVIEYAEHTFTENYLEASIAWENSNNKNSFENAIHIIEKGIQDIGPLMLFYNRLVQLHKTKGNFDQAILNQNIIINISNRKERPYYQRALIYLEQGNSEAAKADLKQSKVEIKKLPQRIRINKSTENLLNNILEKEKTIL